VFFRRLLIRVDLKVMIELDAKDFGVVRESADECTWSPVQGIVYLRILDELMAKADVETAAAPRLKSCADSNQ
jgi:hypothetical protein